MATQVMGQSSGAAGLFSGGGGMGMALPGDMYDLHELSKAELAAPQLIMLANVALTGEVSGGCCDYLVGEERQMAELVPVGESNFSDSDGEGEGLEEAAEVKGAAAASGLADMELAAPLGEVEPPPEPVFEAPAAPAPEAFRADKEAPGPGEERGKAPKAKPFRCKPCQYEAESEEQFVHHIRVHSAKKFFVEESAEKQAKAREPGAEEGDFSKGPIRCDRCGYNTNRYDHYTAHLRHHTRAGGSERVFKCVICTYTTVSEYHWRKHLRNHFPRKVYTCGKCSYFSDRKNNYVQHVRTHTGERPYKCELCPYSSSQKTHLTRHMRTHSGEKPFKCDQCSYVASNQHEVTRHARQVHNGPKPLNCPHCDYKTADRSNFKKHVELHVNPRQFNCPVCDYAASKKCNLQYHFKSKHPTCPNKTMDVSKVKLKKTKKREADMHDNSITNEKTETEQTKIKGDVTGKKNEKSVKMEKKDTSREKKPCGSISVVQVTRTRKSETKETEVPSGNDISVAQVIRTRKSAVETKEMAAPSGNSVSVVQVTRTRKSAAETKEMEAASGSSVSVVQVTRTRKSAVGTKEMEAPSGNKSEKVCKTRKNKRKAEAEAHSLPDPVSEAPTARKKKRIENRSRNSPDVPKRYSKMERKKVENKKQNTCFKKGAKKKALKNKSSKGSSKSAQKVPPRSEPAQAELSPPGEPTRVEAQAELSPPGEPTRVEAQAELSPPGEPTRVEAQAELSPPGEPTRVEAQAELSPPGEPTGVEAQAELSPPGEPTRVEAQAELSPPGEPTGVEAQAELSPPGEPTRVEAQAELSPGEQAGAGGPAFMEVVSAAETLQMETPAPMEIVPAAETLQMETPAPMEIVPAAGPPQVETPVPMEIVPSTGSPQVETPVPMEIVPSTGSPQVETPAPIAPVHMAVAQVVPPPVIEPPVHIKPTTRRSSPRKDNKKEKLDIESEMARQEQVLIEVGLVPVRESRLTRARAASGASAVLSAAAGGETTRDHALPSEGDGARAGAEEAGEAPADGTACLQATSDLPSEKPPSMPEGEPLGGNCQRDSTTLGAVTAEQNTAETAPGEDSAPGPDTALHLSSPVAACDPGSQAVLASPPATAAGNESQEIDEDEGIHSHDGSDLSDNMSEGSDDSGLHGARPAPQETSSKTSKDTLAVKVTEGDFVCIFCDRSFRKEKDYSKHLNRHLVNVYFLEKAAKGQE
uniref:RE1-silencing transcription factor isoform X2 n=1 Tax=Jaculus jaculus TaxID=51337 RepID=UPI001E1B55E9|nr:RE1-silencing transcription factor isoform X2 [Jaculus jaculus]